MATNDNPIAPELEEQFGEEEYYNRELFVSIKCHQLNDRLASKNITKERSILLDNLQAKMPGFYKSLEANGWLCFAPEPIKANVSMVREFYVNASETNFTGLVAIV